MLCVVGTPPLCPCVHPSPSLGVSGGSGHVLPPGEALRPSPGDSVPGTLPHLFLPDPWVTLPSECLEALALPGQDGGGQALPVGLDCTYVNSANPTPHFL